MHILQFLKITFLKVGPNIKTPNLPIGKLNGERIIRVWLNFDNARVHRVLLSQRLDLEDRLALSGQFPIGHQFLSYVQSVCSRITSARYLATVRLPVVALGKHKEMKEHDSHTSS
jgi:hypothetical protein